MCFVHIYERMVTAVTITTLSLTSRRSREQPATLVSVENGPTLMKSMATDQNNVIVTGKSLNNYGRGRWSACGQLIRGAKLLKDLALEQNAEKMAAARIILCPYFTSIIIKPSLSTLSALSLTVHRHATEGESIACSGPRTLPSDTPATHGPIAREKQ
ncbi:hypothetical protein ROHU_018908 [Labeo rohita]|uniref:Uncharacterized protein n=1 Tax=Labeo rohita TaxID=84645 RepID=A0A498N468_LABRO|nr:hypothetical protein ROHU_018908 [Labeo rohita]